MANYDDKLNKERIKAISELLISEVRLSAPSTAAINTMIQSGADVCYGHSKCLYYAARELKTDTAILLIKAGALKEKAAATYIAQMCEAKGFCDTHLESFFALINLCVDSGFDRVTMLTPFINAMAVSGKMDVLQNIMKRFYLTESEVASCIYIRIIFEIILNAHDDVLDFVNRKVDWINQASFDLAVSSGDWLTLEYILSKASFTPSIKAVAQAVFAGSAEVLDILISRGFKFDKQPLFLKNACRAANGGNLLGISYLLKNGYKLSDMYDGATIKQNAQKDKNEHLLKFLATHNV